MSAFDHWKGMPLRDQVREWRERALEAESQRNAALTEVERLRTENARVRTQRDIAEQLLAAMGDAAMQAERKPDAPDVLDYRLENARLRALLVEAAEALRAAETLIDILRFKYEQERKVAAALDAHHVETRIGAVLAKLPVSEPTDIPKV